MPFTRQWWGRVVGEEAWGGLEGFIALSRSVKTHPFFSLLCPCSPPPVVLPSAFTAPSCDAMQALCTLLMNLSSISKRIPNNNLCIASLVTVISPLHRAFTPDSDQTLCSHTQLHNGAELHNVCWSCQSVMWHSTRGARRSRIFLKVCHYCWAFALVTNIELKNKQTKKKPVCVKEQ